MNKREQLPALLCKGSCRGATEGLLGGFCSFFAIRQRTNQENVREECLSTPSDPRAKRRVGTQLRNLNITPFGHRHKRLCRSTDTVYGLGLHREAYFTDFNLWTFLIRLWV